MISSEQVTDLRAGMEEHVRLTREVLDQTDYDSVGQLVEKLHEAYEAGRRVFIFGNGGSAACASHFAEDLAKGILDELEGRRRLKVLSLTDSVPFLSALGNDCGYETVVQTTEIAWQNLHPDYHLRTPRYDGVFFSERLLIFEITDKPGV